MDKRAQILAAADRAFQEEGFQGVGIDRILAPLGASTRTLYKHFGSKDGLAAAVLADRDRRFLAALSEGPGLAQRPVPALFDGLRRWMAAEGTHGCLFLRALGEYAGRGGGIAGQVRAHKAAVRAVIAARVAAELGRPDEAVSSQIWLLFEGATAAAVLAGADVVAAAEDAAAALLSAARGSRA